MPFRYTYLALAVIGFIFPYAEFVPFLWAHGPDWQLFSADLFASRASRFFAWDVFVSALALFLFIYSDGRQLGMRHLWVPIAGTLLVGVSFGLPLFLYMRQGKIMDSLEA